MTTLKTLSLALLGSCLIPHGPAHGLLARVLQDKQSLQAQPIWGVTIDDVSPLSDIVGSLSKLKQKPTARIVFDENVRATYYAKSVPAIHAVAGVMGEILDSFFVKGCDLNCYTARTREYLAAFPDTVDIWEVGNEINGEWLEPKANRRSKSSALTAMPKAAAAYDLVKAAGKKAALTLYFNQDCWSNPKNEMFAWAKANVPDRMKQGLDYVWVSYYEHDCNDLRPDWQGVFDRLHAMFPNSLIGFGETGSDKPDAATYLARYYGLKITTPNYVGGYFWWYFTPTMVPWTKPMWKVLNNAIQ